VFAKKPRGADLIVELEIGGDSRRGCGKDSWHVDVCHFPERVFFVKGLLVRFLGLLGLVFAYVDRKKSRRGFSKWAILYFLRT
jgi:hypothetical protein